MKFRLIGLLFLLAGEAYAVCTPTEQWLWAGPDVGPPLAGVLVVQLSDDNLDGIIDDTDIPEVLFLAGDSDGQLLMALDGVTGSQLVRSASYDPGVSVSGLVPPAAADIDGDGIVEIVTFREGGIAAFEHDLTLKWQSTESTSGFSIGIADLVLSQNSAGGSFPGATRPCDSRN